MIIDLLEPDIYRYYSARPERIRGIIEANPKKELIIIDEIQKVTPLLDPIHALMEEKKNLQFILTGSSSRKLKRSGVDLLAGRAIVRAMHPFMAAESGVQFNLSAALRRGLIPVIVSAEDPDKALKAYVELYIKEEVLFEGLVRHLVLNFVVL